MAELVDALDLGSSILTDVGVRVPPLVPYKTIKILKDMELDFLTPFFIPYLSQNYFLSNNNYSCLESGKCAAN